MSLLSLTSRVIRLRTNLLSLRCLSEQKLPKPNLRFKEAHPKSKLFDSKAEVAEYEKQQKNETGPIKWILLGVPIVTFILGTWQVERRKWKLNLLEDLHRRTHSEPKPLPEDLSELLEMEYCPIKVKGKFLYEKEFTVGPKSLIVDGAGTSEKGGGGGIIGGGGRTGFWVITPFKLEDRDLTILINRGWIPTRIEKYPVEKLAHIPGTFEITGLLRLHEERPPFMPKNKPESNLWFHRDLRAMAEVTGADPIYLDLIARDGAPGGPIAGQTRVFLRNEHFSYIVTWYLLSMITSWFWFRLYIQKLPLL